MECLRCGAQIEGGKALCEKCLSEGRRFPAETPPHFGRAQKGQGFWKNFLTGAAIIMAALYLGKGQLSPRIMPEVKLDSTGARYGMGRDPCLGKERCLIAYVATWCPACHSSLPFISGLRDEYLSSRNVGVKIIAGGGDPRTIDMMALKIRGNVFLDTEDKFYKAANTGGVPHFWLVDDTGKILKSFAGAFSEYTPDTRDLFLTRKLGSESRWFLDG